MSKRKRNVVEEETPKKVATPENPTSDVPSAIHVNPSYDQMPDEINDPASVFRLAYLDMKHTAIHNKLAYVAQDFEKRIQLLNVERNNALNNLKADLRRAENDMKAAKDEIERKYNIALRSYTYDDVTGVLTKQAFVQQEEEKSKREKEKEQAPAAGAPGSGTIH